MAPDNYTELKMCRVCLALDVRMYDMKDLKLSEMFHNITGIMVYHNKSKVYRICWECAARLTAAAAFRDKALLSDALLKDFLNIQPSDIASIKENYSCLKPSLTVHTIFNALDIECTDTEDVGINNDMDIKVTENNPVENECEDLEPWIEAPVKMEVETDPLIEEKKPDLFLDTANEEQDNEDKNPILDEDESDTSSSGDDSSDETFDNEVETEMSSNVRTMSRNSNKSKNKQLHDDMKQRIIALKEDGVPTRRVARLLHISRNTVRKWWVRWSDKGHLNNFKRVQKKRKTTPQDDQRLIDRVSQEQSVHTPTLAKELGISTSCVIKRLKEAGFRLKQKKASVPLRSGRSHKVDEATKQQIISMKQNGISVTEIANQFRVTRTSVYRWCKENNINVTSDHTGTTTELDQDAAEDGNIGNSAKPPVIISSHKSVWQKLPDVEFVS